MQASRCAPRAGVTAAPRQFNAAAHGPAARRSHHLPRMDAQRRPSSDDRQLARSACSRRPSPALACLSRPSWPPQGPECRASAWTRETLLAEPPSCAASAPVPAMAPVRESYARPSCTVMESSVETAAPPAWCSLHGVQENRCVMSRVPGNAAQDQGAVLALVPPHSPLLPWLLAPRLFSGPGPVEPDPLVLFREVAPEHFRLRGGQEKRPRCGRALGFLHRLQAGTRRLDDAPPLEKEGWAWQGS